ncbi:protein kinase [Streptomyces sp. YC537]|uniref:Protein kinase n=2 Tax=Streptomyces boluensis TaxID=1775135 RepID=A0A964US50_9ACTN|nr:protein kinase [Streptomyces boluensis]
MGVVYLAQDSAGRLVALKRLRDELASDAEFRARFRREAAALLRVQGSCTARVLAVEVEASSPFVVMEYVQGPTLAEHVGEHGPLRGDMAYSFALGLAEALAAIHRAGVVHRDLKPGNVLLSDQGPKVIDFGIAQAADATALTRTGSAIGTVGYMAPEQVRGQAGPPADVFAWALTVAYATTGRPPFGTGPAAAVLHRVLHEDPDLDGVPARLTAVLASALSRTPERRPAPEQLISELADAQEPGTTVDIEAVGTVVATTWQMPAPAAPSAAVPGRRRTGRTALAVAALAVALLSTAGIVLWAVLPDRGASGASGTTPSPNPPTSTVSSSSPTTSAPPPTTPSVPPSQTPPPSPSTSSASSASTGPIKNTHSGLCVDTDGPQRPGLHVELRPCGNYSGQRWRYDETSQRFMNTPSDLCLDTDGAPATDVAAVLKPCGDYSGQQWRHDADENQFVNPQSGLCLDTNGPPATHVDLVLRPCRNLTGQHWQL